MATIPIKAYAIASTLPLKELAFLFDGVAELVRASKTVLVARYCEGEGWTVLHDFGAVVFFGVAEGERDRIVAEMRKFDVRDETVEGAPAPLAESFQVEISAEANAPTVKFDSIVVRELTASVREVVAFVVGQSVAMEYYEQDVDALLVRLQRVASGLQHLGRFRIRARELMRLVGRGMSLRNRMVHTLALLDSPELAWNDEVLDRLYRELRTSFGIDDRYRALDHKLQMIGSNLELFVDLTQHRRAIFLEVLVVVLIAIEVVLFLLTMKH